MLEQCIQLAAEVQSWSLETLLHRCVVCCLHILEIYSPLFTPSISQFSPPLSVTFARQQNKVLVIRCWLSRDRVRRDRQQAESETISHLRLILFKEKESSKALLFTDTKAVTLKHTCIQNSVQQILENQAFSGFQKVWSELSLAGHNNM